MATVLRVIPYVEHFSFGRVLTLALCSLASLAFQYKEAPLSHRALQANNCSLALLCKRTCTRWHCVFHIKERNAGLCKLSMQGKVPFRSTGQMNTSHSNWILYFLKTILLQCSLSGVPMKISRRNRGCRGSPVMWNILKPWFISAVCQSFSLCIFFFFPDSIHINHAFILFCSPLKK